MIIGAADILFSPPPSNSDQLRVPFNKSKFRRFRGWQSAIASLGIGMSLVACGSPAVALYEMWIDPAHESQWIPVLWLSGLFILIVGSAAWPALQQAKTANAIVNQNLPALIVTREGIWDYSSNYVFGFVSWAEIDTVIATSRHSSELNKDFPGIAFVVKNKNVLLKRKPGLMGFWVNMDPEITERRQVFIPQGRIDVPITAVLDQIKTYRPR